MNFGSVKVITGVAVGAFCCAGIIVLSCGGPTAPSGSTTTPLTNLVVTSQVPGWVLDSAWNDSAMPFTDATATNFVDGGCIDYCGPCNGADALKNGIATYFKSTQGGHKMEAFVLDYGTSSAAKTEFNVWVSKDSAVAKETIPPFATTTAIGYVAGGGMTVFANISNFFIQMQFTDYDSSSQAVPDAAAFLNYYKPKIK